jgi:hypothetical protein
MTFVGHIIPAIYSGHESPRRPARRVQIAPDLGRFDPSAAETGSPGDASASTAPGCASRVLIRAADIGISR